MSQVSTPSCPSSRPSGRSTAPPVEFALVEARRRIARFRAWPPLSPGPLAVVHSVVEHALAVAPQPVSPRWTSYSLAVVGELVRWADRTGQPLDVESLLSVESRARFINVAKAHLGLRSRASYRSRLELIAIAHQVDGKPCAGQPPFPKASSSAPLSSQDEADLWAWASGLRPWTRRASMQAIVALGLGVGLAQTDASRIQGRHIETTADGATAVTVPDPEGAVDRTVVGRRVWERRLAGMAEAAGPEHWLVSPWRRAQQSPQALDQLRWKAQGACRCPVEWSPLRLRTTWLARHLAAGTHLPTLLEAAGLTTLAALVPLLPHAPQLSAEDAAEVLRGGG